MLAQRLVPYRRIAIGEPTHILKAETLRRAGQTKTTFPASLSRLHLLGNVLGSLLWVQGCECLMQRSR
jgi:hypothetical protein